MIRRVPLRRSYMKRSPPRRIARETPEETVYKDWIHTQRCVVDNVHCLGMQASHVGHGGMGQKKGSWFDAVPMCGDVHRLWETHTGLFLYWDRDRRRAESLRWIQKTRAAARAEGLTVPDLASDPE